MIIKIKSLSEEVLEQRDYRDFYMVAVDDDVDETELRFNEDWCEDNTLSRNFNDVYSIPKILKMAYEAGIGGEELEIIEEEITDIEDI